MHINLKFSTSWYYPFWWKWPDMFKKHKEVGNIFAIYICNILRKIDAIALCSIVMKSV